MMVQQTYDENSPHLRFVPLDELTTPPTGCIEHVRDAWWVVHPERGAVFWRRVESAPTGEWERGLSPQYNHMRSAAKLIVRMYPWARLQQIPSAFYRAPNY